MHKEGALPDPYAGQRTTPGPVHTPLFDVDLGIDLKRHDLYLGGTPAADVTALRKAAPIFWHPEDERNEPGFWVLTRHADVQAVSKNPELFSSEIGAGALLSFDENRRQPLTSETLAIRRANMVNMDPPDHRTYRSLVMPYLAGPASKRLEPAVTDRISALLDTIRPNESFDLVSAFSAVTPAATMCHLLGVPEEDQDMVVEWGDTLAAVGDPELADEVAATHAKVYKYGMELFERKRSDPGHDLLSAAHEALAKTDRPLRPYSVESLFSLMIVAGHRTTRNTTTSGLLELYRNPGQIELLRDKPELIGNAIEEILRYTTVVPLFRRTATADTEIAGQKIAAGEKVVMWYSAANRDESVFPDPDRFDIERPEARKHLTFGHGEHMCVGNMVARLQLRIAIAAFINRFDTLEVVEPPEYLRTNQAVSIKRVMVRVS